MAENQLYKRSRTLSLPTSNLQAGDEYALYVGGGKYKTFVVNDSLQLTEEAGAEFIECDTVDDLRSLDSRQIWSIQNGYYKGVTLNGYYKKQDTPAPIDYILSDTVESDDGGSVFEVGGIKLEHEFVGEVNILYFGSTLDNLSTVLPIVASKYKKIKISQGDYYSKKISLEYTDVDLNFDNSSITYDINGDNQENTVAVIEIINSNVRIKNLNVIGRMFYKTGDIPPETGTVVDTQDSVLSDRHRAFNVISSSVKINDVNVKHFPIAIRAIDSCIHGDNINISDGGSGLVIIGTHSIKSELKNTVLKDMRFNFHTMTSTDSSIPGNVTGARGQGVLTDNDIHLICEKVKLYRCGTDSFRAQGDSLMELNYCSAYQGRRHHISNYGINSKIIVNNFKSFYVGDYLFWNGNYLTESFRRANSEGQVRDIVVTNENGQNSIYLNNVDIEGYVLENKPVSNDITGAYNATVPAFHISSLYQGQVEANNINIKSSFTSNSISIENSSVLTNINIDTTYLGSLLTTLSSVVILKKPSIVNGLNITGGYHGLYINDASQSINQAHYLSNIIISNTEISGIRIYSENVFFSNVKLLDCNTLDIPQYASLVIVGGRVQGDIDVKNTSGSNRDLAINIATSVSECVLNAKIDGFDRLYNTTTTANTAKSDIITRPINVNYPNTLIDEGSLVHRGYIDQLLATPTVKGLVNQATAVEDVTTPDATDDVEAIALVNELKAKINEMLASDRTSGQRST